LLILVQGNFVDPINFQKKGEHVYI
jgi:hypothetical protein